MKIHYSKQFVKVFEKLLPKVKERFYERFDAFVVNKYNPLLDNHSVDKAYPGCRSIDIAGDYRAIFFEEGEVVTFVAIGTHAQLYK